MARKKTELGPADNSVRRKVKDLVPDARNANTHPESQIKLLMGSIKEWGFTIPVLIDEDDGIIAGHGRVLAAERLGMDEIPCVLAKGWSEDQKRTYIIADNKLASLSVWDEDLLKAELLAIHDGDLDLDLTGFTDADLDLDPGEDPDVDGDPPDDKFSEQFGVIITCDSEANQQEVYEKMLELGYNAKVVTT